MKTSILTTALACFGVAILPLHAEDDPTTKLSPATSDVATPKTISTYIVHISGSG